MLRISRLGAVLIVATICSTSTFAQVRTLTESHTYIMGDNDSKNDARQLCFLEAKRKVLEKAGVFIESETEVRNFQFSKSQIRSYAAAVLSVESVGEQQSSANAQAQFVCTVRAQIDIADVKQRLAAISGDKSVQAKIEQQQAQIRQLESQIQQLNGRLQTTGNVSPSELRKERNVVIGNLTEVENAKIAAVNAMQTAGQRARYVVAGMTQDEVRLVAGDPRAFSQHICVERGSRYNCDSWNYGGIWVLFGYSRLAECVSQASDLCRQ